MYNPHDKHLDIHEIAYHRNGICGEGFFVVRFTDPEEGRRFVGVVFGYLPECDREDGDSPFLNPVYADPHVAILDTDLVGETVEFGVNSWRGDNYATVLYRAIDTFYAEKS